MKFKFDRMDYEYDLYLEYYDTAIMVTRGDNEYLPTITLVDKITGSQNEIDWESLKAIYHYISTEQKIEFDKAVIRAKENVRDVW